MFCSDNINFRSYFLACLLNFFAVLEKKNKTLKRLPFTVYYAEAELLRAI